MALPAIPTRHLDSAAHRQRISETVNGVTSFQFDDSRVRTQAEITAGVTPVNYAYEVLNLRRYGGAPGSQDNTAAMDQAEAICAAQDGGTIYLDTPGEWRMNWVCTTDSVVVLGPGGGAAEFDVACIRPYSLLSAPITFGDGSVQLRYCEIRNVHMSGTDDVGGANFAASAHSAPACLKLYGVISFRSYNCRLYNGIHTLHIEPSVTVPVTDIRFYDTKARNDIADSQSARLIYGLRLDESLGGGYYTDVLFFGFKGNGPKTGYFAEFDGTIVGLQGRFIAGYVDITAGCGVLLKGAAGFYPSDDFDLDPGTTGAVVVETDQVQGDPTRYIFGQFGHGGQKMQFSGTVLDSGTAQSVTGTTLVLRAAAAFADSALIGSVVRVLTATTGSGQSRVIRANVGATDTLTVDAWTTTPTGTITYAIYKTIDLPAEADWYLYRPRIFRGYFGATNYVTTADDPFSTTVSWDLEGTTGPLTLSGSQLKLNAGLRLASTDVIQEFYESDQGADGKLWWERSNSGVWSVQTRFDDGTTGKLGITISRSGTTITATELGNATDLPPNTLHGHLRITDGITAPSTAAGFAAIYVDAADGDLKVKFGDGTVKTISVDT